MYTAALANLSTLSGYYTSFTIGLVKDIKQLPTPSRTESPDLLEIIAILGGL